MNQGFRLLDDLNSIAEQMGDTRPLLVEPVARAALVAADSEQATSQLLDIETIAEYR